MHRLKWVVATRNGGSPPTSATSTQLTPNGVGVEVYGFRCLGEGGIADFYNGNVATPAQLKSTCYAGDGGNDRDGVDGNGGSIYFPNGVYVRVFGSPYDAAILVDESTRES